MEMMDIAVNRLADPATPPELIDDLLSVLNGVFEGTTGGGGQILTPAQGQVLSARWRTFLTAHRATSKRENTGLWRIRRSQPTLCLQVGPVTGRENPIGRPVENGKCGRIAATVSRFVKPRDEIPI